mmetsp:Transcript_65534/g.156643  ORF Transcript_65534/g.156643 Transcript_65534/m.156643 type:complete len:259 (-) Transcript_65534:918-1694(-)
MYPIPQQAYHLKHHQVPQGDVKQEDVQAAVDEFLTVQVSRLVHIQHAEQLRHALHRSLVKNVVRHLHLSVALCLLNLLKVDLLVPIPVQLGEDISELRDHGFDLLVAQLHLFLLLLASMLQGAFYQHRRDQVHQGNGDCDDQEREVDAQRSLLVDQWEINGGDRIHGDKLGQSHHCDKNAAEIQLNDRFCSGIFPQGLIVRNHLYAQDCEDVENKHQQCQRGNHGVAGGQQSEHQPPNCAHLSDHSKCSDETKQAKRA